ncbi:MAG: serine protease [Rhizobiaceae bacterium]
MNEENTDKNLMDNGLPVAVLEHLTGPARGTLSWLGASALEISLDSRRCPQLRVFITDEPAENAIARLTRLNSHFEIETVRGNSVWVNGRAVTHKRLENHDMIEFGASGPMSRFCLCANRQPIQRAAPGVINDLVAYFRTSRRPIIRKIAGAFMLAFGRLALGTTNIFRIGVIIALVALGTIVYQQAKMNALLRERVASGSAQLEELSQALARNREEAITPADLETLRQDLGAEVETAAERLTWLEERSTASARVIRQSQNSVFLVQAAYGFRSKESQAMLRQVLGPDGKPLLLPNGLLMLSLDGDGPVAERQSISTAFALRRDGILVTNRHVAFPWEQDAIATTMSERGLEPILLKLIVYAPGHAEPLVASLRSVSDADDLALLQAESIPNESVGLELADQEPQPGQEIIVMGYPTGLRSLLAQAGSEFVELLQKERDLDFWNIAKRLAEAGRIVPLASRGIIGRSGAENIVYDAETTHGGSGGPVLDSNGKVIAVNTAILPEYGGSNLGIPSNRIRRLLSATFAEN